MACFLIFEIKALGDERRSFSYYKAIPVIEKLPFKIESIHQVKDLPAIGKSLQDHVSETTIVPITNDQLFSFSTDALHYVVCCFSSFFVWNSAIFLLR